MHFLYCIIAALIVLFIGLCIIARYSREADPEDKDKEDAKVIDLDESLRDSIRYEWREKAN